MHKYIGNKVVREQDRGGVGLSSEYVRIYRSANNERTNWRDETTSLRTFLNHIDRACITVIKGDRVSNKGENNVREGRGIGPTFVIHPQRRRCVIIFDTVSIVQKPMETPKRHARVAKPRGTEGKTRSVHHPGSRSPSNGNLDGCCEHTERLQSLF